MGFNFDNFRKLLSDEKEVVGFETRADKIIMYMDNVYATEDMRYVLEKLGMQDKITVFACRKRRRTC
jgi:hypothetical protein